MISSLDIMSHVFEYILIKFSFLIFFWHLRKIGSKNNNKENRYFFQKKIKNNNKQQQKIVLT